MDLFTLMGKIVIESGESTAEIDDMIAKAQSLSGLLGGTTNTAENTSKSLVTSTKNAATGVGKAVSTMQIALGNLATQGFNKLSGYGKSFFQTGFEFNQNMEKWTASFKTYMGGDLEKAQAFMEEVRQFAIDTPLSLESSVQSAVRLMASGVESSDVIDKLRMLGDITNGDTEKMSRLGLVLSQVLSAKKLKGNDPNQFKEAGVPIYDLLLDYYHANGYDYIDSAFLMEMQAKGGITSDEVLGALEMATSPDGLYYNAMNNIMETEYGKAQKMKDAYEQAAGAATKAIFDVFSSDTIPALNEILQQLNEWATENPEALKNLSEAFSEFATKGLSVFLDGLQNLLTFWNDNQDLFNSMLVLFGALMVSGGNVKTGAALMALGGVPILSDETEEKQKELTGLTSDVDLPFIRKQLLEQGKPDVWDSYIEDWKNARRKEGYLDEEINGFINNQFEGFFERYMSDGLSFLEKAALELDLLFNNGEKYKKLQEEYEYWEDPMSHRKPETDGTEGYGESGKSGSLQWLLDNMHNQDMQFASANGMPERGRFGVLPDDSGITGDVAASIQALAATVQSLAGEVQSLTGTIPEAIASGISGITVTGTVTTGNVMLNTGAIVGQLAPRLNLALGALGRLSGRGG